MKTTLLSLATLLLAATALFAQQQKHKLLATYTDYLIFFPKGYEENPDKRWPTIVFLHGAEERGVNINNVKQSGPPNIVEQNPDFPFIVISPLCPDDRLWSVPVLNDLLDNAIKDFHVDPSRIYLTGISMGGFAVWEWAIRSPERFAAIAPIGGGGTAKKAWKLRNLPVWAFHCDSDPTVPKAASELMVKAVKEYNKQASLTVFPDTGPDSWKTIYNNPKLYDWFLENKRYQPEPKSLVSEELKRYVGVYQLNLAVNINILLEDGRLFGQPTGQPRRELVPTDEGKFIIPDFENEQIQFMTNEEGKVDKFLMFSNEVYTAVRID